MSQGESPELSRSVSWFLRELWKTIKYIFRRYFRQIMIVLVVIILFAATFYGGMRYERFRADKSVKTVESDRLNLPTGAKVTAPARIEGSVTKIDDKSITIKGNDGKAVSYTFDTKVTVLAAGKIAKMEVIKVGDSVRLYTKSGADNSNIINRISDLSTK